MNPTLRTRRPRTALAILAIAMSWIACTDDEVYDVDVEDSYEYTFQGSPIGALLPGPIGWTQSVDVGSSEAFESRGLGTGDITDVHLTYFDLALISPAHGDLAFIQEIAVYIDADGLDRKKIADQDTFPPDETFVELNVLNVDLTDYALKSDAEIEIEVIGEYPLDDHTVEAAYGLNIGITSKGACNAIF